MRCEGGGRGRITEARTETQDTVAEARTEAQEVQSHTEAHREAHQGALVYQDFAVVWMGFLLGEVLRGLEPGNKLVSGAFGAQSAPVQLLAQRRHPDHLVTHRTQPKRQ